MQTYITPQSKLKFNKSHIVNPTDYVPTKKGTRVQAHLIYNECGTICVVFADCLETALDIAVDNDRFECQRIEDCPPEEDCHGANLGNYGDLYDLNYVNFELVPTPFQKEPKP